MSVTYEDNYTASSRLCDYMIMAYFRALRSRAAAQRRVVAAVAEGDVGPLLAQALLLLSNDIHEEGDRASVGTTAPCRLDVEPQIVFVKSGGKLTEVV